VAAAISRPYPAAVVGTPRLLSARSTISSWIRVAVWSTSMAVAAPSRSSCLGSPMRALNTRSSGLRRFPPDVRASSDGSTRSAGALPATPTSRPSTSSMISKAPSGSPEWSLLACVVWPDPPMEHDDAACDALPCNVL